MATLREYYERDFSHSARIHIKVPLDDQQIQGTVSYDFAGYCAFLSLYVSGNKDMNFFVKLLESLFRNPIQVELDGRVTLPSAKVFPGQLLVQNTKTENFEILAQYFGDSEWMSTKNIEFTRRVFICSESDLPEQQIGLLKMKAKEFGRELQFRAGRFREERSKHEKPLAFISHDSRDKDAVAGKIALGLQGMLCPVWYDEFSLKIGDNLRDSIERGLKECKKCILVLSPNFLSNEGWTKTEFDSIFTRQILEEQKLVLPVWFNVSKRDVYNYSPSLLNVKGADWNNLGEEEVCRQIYGAIMA